MDSALSLFEGEHRYGEIFAPYFSTEEDPALAMLYFETDNFLVKNLHYLDRSSMAYGLESRVPYLDHELVEWAAGLPEHYKLDRRLRSKAILKDAYADVIPAYVTKRRKAGFGMPLRSLFSNPALLDRLLPEAFCESLGCIDMDALRRIKSEHLNGEKDQSALMYALVVLGVAVD
ncbi:MAG: asparagine synthase C-terminal domain-containing protein [Flavobacteriales bacterium]|nr:asparagine synthase C-terminal domain-containing protein [Flavobacteriales bacterium]